MLVENQAVKALATVPKTGFLKNGSYDLFLKNTHFGMWKVSPKTQNAHIANSKYAVPNIIKYIEIDSIFLL
jgi:hypothetical protein